MQRKFKHSIFMVVIALIASTFGVSAQVTTSALAGLVTDDANEPIIGAVVTAVHEPSGTRYGATTNVDGRYAIQGMKAGGPYSVTFSFLGMQTKTVKDVTLRLGETDVLDVQMATANNELQEVVVSATGGKFSNNAKTGATTNISQAQMNAMPTVSRSISDMAKLSPYANGMSFAGGDGRSTNFTVDGANFNNNFGLSSSLPGGGNPISLDAIQEMQVVIAPFDVRQTNFIGGGINAVTKSGTNKFNGTAYGYYTDQDMRGNKVDGKSLGDRPKESKTIYGFTLGGPIVKNKLFFFVNYENEKSPYQVIKYRARQEGEKAGDNVSQCSIADMQRVADHLRTKYGYDPGSFTSFPGDESNHRFLARLDWNITDAHRLSVRYNATKNVAWNAPNGSSADTGARLTDNRVGPKSMAFANSMYSMDNDVSTWAAELNSRFSNKVSNQALFTFTQIKDIRGTNSSPFPFIDIMAGLNDVGNQILEPYMTAGYELFTYNNGVKNNTLNFVDNATILLGSHKITAGASFEHQFANNAYMRNGTGYYRYRSVDDFINGAAPESFALTYGFNGVKNPTAQVTFNQYGLYGQDEWNVTRDLLLTYGVRFDMLNFDNDDIATNKAIYSLGFNGHRIDTGKWPSAKLQVSPRVGFKWDINGDKALTLRGGTGLFAGRLPLVFFTNMPTNANMIQNSIQFKTTYNSDGSVKSADPRLADLAGGLITNVDELIAKFGFPTELTADKHYASNKISGVERNFKMPQVWKSSLALDYKLPVAFPFTVTTEFMYTKNINAVTMKNINVMNPDETWSRFEGADNRYIYPSNYYYNGKGRNAVVLTNTDKGYGYTANITLNARPIESLGLMMSYTHTEAKEVSGMPGSDPVAAWQNLITVNGPNNATVQRSRYVVPNRLTGSATWTIPGRIFNLGATTNLSMFYTGYSASGDSWIYTNDMNGDGNTYDLMYIPKDDSEIKFVSEADRKAFWDFVAQDKYLSSHKGQYAEAYAARAPWVNKFDLRIMEEFEVKVGNTKNALQVSLDFINIGNLFNSSWGVQMNDITCNSHKILTYDAKATKANGNVPTFSMYKNKQGEYATTTYSSIFNSYQTWRLQLGVKYLFKM